MFNKLISKIKVEKNNQSKDSKKVLKDFSIQIPLITENKDSYLNDKINSFYYIKNYIPESIQSDLITVLDTLPEEDWIHLPHSKRRLLKVGGDVMPEGLKNKKKLPWYLDKLKQSLEQNKLTSKPINHVLVNDYPFGSGIMPHLDGPLYHGYVTVISLNSSCIMKFFKNMADYKKDDSVCSFLVEPRSLYIFTGEAYTNYLHCISDIKFDNVYLKADIVDNRFIIKQSSVDNFETTDIYDKIKEMPYTELIKQYRIEEVKGETYNYCLVLKRERRVSLTLRHVKEYSTN